MTQAQQPSPLVHFKLHGCIDHVHDPNIPLVLTPETYNNHDINRQLIYAEMEGLSRYCPFIFCGHSLKDLHIHRLVEGPKAASRPFYYIVSPEFEPEEMNMWMEKRVEPIQATFAKFMDALDRELPPLMRVPPRSSDAIERPYRKHFKVQQNETDQAEQAFVRDVEFLHSDLALTEVSADRFYSGYDQSWTPIRRKLDVHRRVSHRVLEYIGSGIPAVTQFGVIRGPAGYGKSVALRRAAWELATSFGEFTVWVPESGYLRPEVMQELHDLTGKRLHVFVDRTSLILSKIETMPAASSGRNVPMTLLTAERTNEWSIHCQRLEKHAPIFFDPKGLTRKEVVELLEKLEQHKCLGVLIDETLEKRKSIVNEKPDRQLLVILHEITRGKPFEGIVEDEYRRLSPPEAQEP